MTRKQITSAICEHRRAACDYRFVWRIAPSHQTSGWRRAALTHEGLIRAYKRELQPTLIKAEQAACGVRGEGL